MVIAMGSRLLACLMVFGFFLVGCGNQNKKPEYREVGDSFWVSENYYNGKRRFHSTPYCRSHPSTISKVDYDSFNLAGELCPWCISPDERKRIIDKFAAKYERITLEHRRRFYLAFNREYPCFSDFTEFNTWFEAADWGAVELLHKLYSLVYHDFDLGDGDKGVNSLSNYLVWSPPECYEDE